MPDRYLVPNQGEDGGPNDRPKEVVRRKRPLFVLERSAKYPTMKVNDITVTQFKVSRSQISTTTFSNHGRRVDLPSPQKRHT